MPDQAGIPTVVTPIEVAREKSLGGAIDLCAKAAGFSLDKELQMRLEVDKAQFSRWLSGTEGITWPKLERLMNTCGNDAPVLWMVNQRGYDIATLKRKETELERQIRERDEKIAEQEAEIRLMRKLLGRP